MRLRKSHPDGEDSVKYLTQFCFVHNLVESQVDKASAILANAIVPEVFNYMVVAVEESI